MNVDTNDFDCRHIRGGLVCDYLSPWAVGHTDKIAKMCTCKAHNVTIFPEFSNFGKINQKLVRVKPLFDCPMMQQLRKEGKAPHIMASITKDGITRW